MAEAWLKSLFENIDESSEASETESSCKAGTYKEDFFYLTVDKNSIQILVLKSWSYT